MAHHQHHGADYDAHVSRSLQIRPDNASSTAQMPAISEDDLFTEPDEPPEPYHKQIFTKSTCSSIVRRQSLLTRALSHDQESHDEIPMPEAYFGHLPSVSSTASNFSGRSTGDLTSDDGHHSPSTRASTPSSPRSVTAIPKILLGSDSAMLHSSPPKHDSDDSNQSTKLPEPSVEAQLGRKRCITFACGGKGSSAVKTTTPPKPDAATAPTKRPCTIRFNCPFKASKNELSKTDRHLSPAPIVAIKSDSPRIGGHRRHRDSDTTIKSESLKLPKPLLPVVASGKHVRRASNSSDLGRSEACKFAEFATSEEDVEEWTRESTCHKTRLTVTDTLKKENHIRQLAEECDEEEALDESRDDDDADEVDDLSDDVSDEGFQTDDEEGFADSDDDEQDDSDSDYAWWAPRKSRAASPFIGSDAFRPVVQRRLSDSSIATSDDEEIAPHVQRGRRRTSRKHLPYTTLRPITPELPDSTDFVCGTLDEDRPLEQAYISCLKEREAAKHRAVPQDIDPSFPTSDPEIENDDEDVADAVEESDSQFIHGRVDNVDNREEGRGRRRSPAPQRSPRPSPKRLRSPPPPCKKAQLPRSPAPHALFNNRSSPRRYRSPAPGFRLDSPPPSPRGSTVRSEVSNKGVPVAVPMPFLAERNSNLTHTASLPRSPNPFTRRSKRCALDFQSRMMNYGDDDDGELTEPAKPYTRGAVDIAQGLEKKRLKRREKFYKQYLKKEEKKKSRRPQPGRGAERMRQVGLECATLRGKRMLSI